MKTAMQELWDYVKEDKENINFIVYGKLRNKIIPLLEKEKEQINDAYFEGNEDGYNQEEDYDSENLIDYYEETYKK